MPSRLTSYLFALIFALSLALLAWWAVFALGATHELGVAAEQTGQDRRVLGLLGQAPHRPHQRFGIGALDDRAVERHRGQGEDLLDVAHPGDVEGRRFVDPTAREALARADPEQGTDGSHA